MTEAEKKQFYKSTPYKKLRQKVLAMDHYECVRCKQLYGKYTMATTVHHVNHLEDHPEHGLDLYVNGERNLISLCSRCHNEVHPEKRKGWNGKPLTEERW